MRTRLLLAIGMASLVAIPATQYAIAVIPDPGEPIDNIEQRVSEHAFRFGADQFLPDVSGGSLVWQDQRGNATSFENPVTGEAHNRIWFKDLATRAESPVTTLSTDFGHPKVSGVRAVWHDFKDGQHDIFTRTLPGGPITKVNSPNAKDQLNPAISGNLVVWEDYRNGNADIFARTIGGPEFPIVVADGNQVAPFVSNGTVAWRDSRRGPTRADVWVKVGSNTATRAVRVTTPGKARSFSEFEVAISGTRLLWNESDPGDTLSGQPKVAKTCVMPGPTTPCATSFTVFAPSGSPEEAPAVSDLDIAGSRGSWVGPHLHTVDLATCDPAPCDGEIQVDSAPVEGSVINGALVGNRFVWSQDGFPKTGLDGGLDVYWDDFLNAAPPRRANSIGLGPFARHENPVADGDIVLYRAPGEGDFLNETQVWATDLSGVRTHFAVSTELGTDISRPAIVGTRAAWSDLRNCPAPGGPQVDGDPCELHPADDAFERDPLDSGAEALLSDPAQTGGPVDADGALTAWRCPDSPGSVVDSICVHDGATVDRFDISSNLQDPESLVRHSVRISGNLVVWAEAFFPDEEGVGRLHVLNTTTLDDEVIGVGDGGMGDSGFDISGSEVVFTPGNGEIHVNTATGCGGGGSSCDHSGDATVFEPRTFDHHMRSPTIDGDRVAWVDCQEDFGAPPECDIYTKTLAQSEASLVTNDGDAFVDAPYVDDANDRIYWVDFRSGPNGDIFMESLDSAIPLPAPDTTNPNKPTGFTAVRTGSRIDLAWTNPGAADFFRVRVLRKSGATPPAGLNDTSASVIYEGDAQSFIDRDVTAGPYSYAIFAFDFEPNYSGSATATAP